MKRLRMVGLVLGLFVVSGVALAQSGLLIQRSGGWEYVVGTADKLGQWGIAEGNPNAWSRLVQSNPQLADPDLVKPGDRLRVPDDLVPYLRQYVEQARPDHSRIVDVATPPQVPVADVSASTGFQEDPFSGLLSWMFLIVAALVVWYIIAGRRSLRRQREQTERDQRARQEVDERQAEDARRRQIADPYSGPPVRAEGLASAGEAVDHAIARYRARRGGMSVLEAAQMLPVVTVVRVRLVDIRGEMEIEYEDGVHQYRNIPNWTPAWEVTLSDGSTSLTLMACANDVRSGRRMRALDPSQIRERQVIPITSVRRQVWPVPETDQEAGPDLHTGASADVPEYVSIRMTATRCVLWSRDKSERVIDQAAIPGLVLGVESGQIIATLGWSRRVIGRLVEETSDPTPVTAYQKVLEPAPVGADNHHDVDGS